ncbi:MAG: hypothetical protein IKL43_09085 [Alistipes sp.]|nr:hypothetical protein [Alistipes sp.]
MRKLLMMCAMLGILVSCGERVKTKEEIQEDLTKKAKTMVSEYCKHAYKDYQPMEWFTLFENQAMQVDEVKEQYESLINLRDEIVGDTIRPFSKHPKFEAHGVAQNAFMEALTSYEPIAYCIGHSFSYEGYFGRQIELYYFICVPPEMEVIATRAEMPEAFNPVLIDDYGFLDKR